MSFLCFSVGVISFSEMWSHGCFLGSLIMAQANRWTLKILSLPVFDDVFAQAVLASPLGDIAFVSALNAGSSAEFAQLVFQLSSSFESDVAETLCKDASRLEQFWFLATASEKLYLESTAFQLGFGLCETRSVQQRPSSISKLRKEAAIRSLVAKPSAPSKKLKVADKSESKTPLLDKENAEKARWAARLEAIGRRAGAEAKLFNRDDQSEDLSAAEMAKLKQLVLISGAPRTMAAHIRSFERFEMFWGMHSMSTYPISIDKVLKYALDLDHRECGPSVVPALKTSLKWVASRLAIDLPDLDDRRLRSWQESIVVKRAKTLKEACPIPIEIVGGLEVLVVGEDLPEAARLFIWWLLCMIFASLRFDDAVHVKPSDLKMQEEGLFGVAWQTKVDRKRVGTRFVVPAVGFRESTWLQVGWDLMQAHLIAERDYWVPELNTRDLFCDRPPTHQRTVKWLQFFSGLVVETMLAMQSGSRALTISSVSKFSAHSCRVTLLDAAVHAGRSTEDIGLQANWKNPGQLVLKYTRNRSSVPATMIKQLVRDLTQENHPVLEDENTSLTDVMDDDLDGMEFFTKTPAPGSYYDYKFHATALGDPDTLACKRFLVSDCTSVGNVLPDPAVFCKACAKARPDIAAFVAAPES